MRSDAVSDAESWQKGVWISLLAYSFDQLNGGTIRGAAGFSQNQWIRMGITEREVRKTSPLWTWAGNDLQVKFYPFHQESESLAKRNGANKTNTKRWGSESLSDPGASRDRQTDVQTDVQREGSDTHSPHIPSETEVRDWANGAAGVDPEFAVQQWLKHDTGHRWVESGKLIDWRRRFKGYWDSDRAGWMARKKKNGGGQRASVEEMRSRLEAGRVCVDFEKNEWRDLSGAEKEELRRQIEKYHD